MVRVVCVRVQVVRQQRRLRCSSGRRLLQHRGHAGRRGSLTRRTSTAGGQCVVFDGGANGCSPGGRHQRGGLRQRRRCGCWTWARGERGQRAARTGGRGRMLYVYCSVCCRSRPWTRFGTVEYVRGTRAGTVRVTSFYRRAVEAELSAAGGRSRYSGSRSRYSGRSGRSSGGGGKG